MSRCGVPFLIELTKEAESTDTFTVKSNLRNYGDKLRIKTISVSNKDTNTKVAHVGVMIGGKGYYIETLVLTTAGYFYISKPDILVNSNYQVIVKVVSPSAGDTYYINVIGEIEE